MSLTPGPVLASPPETTRARRTRATPVALGVVAVALLAASAALDLRVSDAERAAALMDRGWTSAAVGLVLTGCAVPVLARFPRHVVGWVMALSGLIWSLDGVAASWTAYGLAGSPDRPLTGFALWFFAQFAGVLLCSLPALLVLYPDGRVPGSGWGLVGRIAIALSFALPVALWFAPASALTAESPLPAETGMPELPLAPGAYVVLLTVARLLTLLSLPLALVLFFVRLRQASGVERRQLRWLMWAAVVCVILSGVAFIAPTGVLPTVCLVAALTVTGASVTIGILAPDLTDVDALMGGTLVYAAVGAAVIALDLALLAAVNLVAGDALDERQVALLVLLVAVAAYGPLRSWLGSGIRRLLVGRRGERYDVVAGLAARLEQSADVRTQLPELASAVATAFKLSYVGVEVFGHAGGVLRASHGSRPPATREVPIRYGAEEVGRLVLPVSGLRAMLSRRDQELLLDVVRQAAIAARSSRLAADLQLSRERLVLAREDDRRRIRRDLHDGLGPALGGVAMRLDAIGNAVDTDPATARRLATLARGEVTDALGDVRRLVNGLRPPALDDLGLQDALLQQADRLASPDLRIDVDAADLPPLPAAVEVAAYRIASDALTNVVKHARASSVHVRLAASMEGGVGELLVEVADDGIGIGETVVAGVGLGSIRERAGELGGHAEIGCPPEGGTLVRAWLPGGREDA